MTTTNKKHAKNKPAADTSIALQGTLELPYATITETASRDTIRDLAKNKEAAYGRQTYFIKYDIIRWRPGIKKGAPGFNGRIKPPGMSEEDWEKELDIETLALDMLKNGHIDPLKGDLSKDGDIFWLTDGERRFRAIGWLLRNAYADYANLKPINMVEVLLNPKDTTEEQRLLLMLSSNNKKNYNPIELGHMFLRLKHDFGYSHDKIHQKQGISRQTVDNYVNLAEEPELIQLAIISGKFTATAALALINAEKVAVKRLEIVKKMLDSGGELKVKDVVNVSKYKDYHGLMAIQVEKFNDEVISYDLAVLEVNSIAAEATKAFPNEKNDIKEAQLNTLEVLDNNNAIQKSEKNNKDTIIPEPPKKSTPAAEKSQRKEAEYDKLFLAVVNDYSEGKILYDEALKLIEDIATDQYDSFAATEHEDIDAQKNKATETIEELKKIKDGRKIDVVETSAANKVEEDSHKTSATNEPYRPSNQGTDALEAIDFTKDRELGEFELNEAIKLQDKLQTKIGLFPDSLAQYKNDCIGLSITIQNKLKAALDIMKKAGDKR